MITTPDQRHLLRALAALIAGLLPVISAASPACVTNCHPFYAGISGGYGSTTWQGLVPQENKQNDAMIMSTPINVVEGGAVWGLYVGYELIPMFALEASYMHYPNARITFDPDSIFTLDNDGQTYLNTNTETLSLMAKIMLMIPKTPIRAYSSFGAALLYRSDQINEQRRLTPTFGLGLNYDVTEHVMLELGGTYTAGNGESELNPVNDFMPFLYAGFLRLGYRL